MSLISADSLVQTEREALRAELNRRAEVRRAEAIIDYQAAERRIERDAAEEVRVSGKLSVAGAEMRRSMREQAVARRRDQLTRSLDYPMTAEEVVAACQHSTLAAKVPPESFEDVSQTLALEVIRKHGPTPPRVKLSAGWLRTRALAIFQRGCEQEETAMGRRAAWQELSEWSDADHRTAVAEAATGGGDAIWQLAAGRPAIDHDAEQLTAERISARLESEQTITHLQADAVRIALSQDRSRPLTNLERQHWHAATAILRKRFHTTDAVRVALHSLEHAAGALCDYVIRSERGTLAGDHLGNHGSHKLPETLRVHDGAIGCTCRKSRKVETAPLDCPAHPIDNRRVSVVDVLRALQAIRRAPGSASRK